MPEPDPQTWTATTSDVANLNAEIRDAFRWLLGHSSNPFPHLRVRGSTPTTLAAPTPPNGTWTTIAFDTAVIDRGFSFAGTVTIPIDGTYDLEASLAIDSCISNKAVQILVNGTVVGRDSEPGPGLDVDMSTSCTVCNLPLLAGDVITVQGYNDRGISSTPATVDAIVVGEAAPVLCVTYVATAN